MSGHKDPWSWLGAGDRLRQPSGDERPAERRPDAANVSPPITRRQLLRFVLRDTASGLGWGVALGLIGWATLAFSQGFAGTLHGMDPAHPAAAIGSAGTIAFLSFLIIWHNLTGETSISIGANFFLAACVFVTLGMVAGYLLAVWIGTGASFLLVATVCFGLIGVVAGLTRGLRPPSE